MGGANAVVVLAVLPLGAFWLLTREPSRRRRALICWWIVATGLACFWWVAEADFVGKFGFNYLPYTETAANTTATTSAFEALRGASYWVDYFHIGSQVLLPGPWILVSTGVVIVGTAVVTALGLAGLCGRIPERLFLVTSLTFGFVVIAAGYAGSSGGPFSHIVQDLLQGPLSPFRNVGKFAPDVALPLVLGLAWTLSAPPWGESRRRLTRVLPGLPVSTLIVSVVAVSALVIASAPYWTGDVYESGGFASVPTYWSQVGSWLDAHQGHTNALLVPGAGFADYTWGEPTDEPIQDLANTSILWRNIIPISSDGYIQMLNAVEQTLDNGTPSPGFAQFLARQGVKYVIERNDLDLTATGAPPPAQVHEVLSETPGLTPVASFGPAEPPGQVQYGDIPVYDSPSDLRLRAVEIYRVDTPTSIVQTYAKASPLIVSGDAGSLLPLTGAGVTTGRASVLSGDNRASGTASSPDATWAITDGNQRRSTAFGGIRNNESYLLNPGQILPGTPTGVAQTFTVVPGTQHQTVEAPVGASSVSASSFGSSFLYDDPSEGPAAAFDGNPRSAWVADAVDNSVGQWISITFDRSLPLSTITITPLVGPAQRPSISQVTISTDRGSVVRSLRASATPQRVSVPRGKSLHLTITIDAVRAGVSGVGTIRVGAGFKQISVPGVSFKQQMQVPNDESSAFKGSKRNDPVVVFQRPIANANLTLGSAVTDDPAMARAFSLPKAMDASISGYVVPSPDLVLQRYLEELAPVPTGSISVTASSWLGDLPRYRPENLVEDVGVPWMASTGDARPVLDLTWSQPRQVGSVSLTLSPYTSRPTQISITSSNGTRVVRSVPKRGGLVTFPPVTTDSLRIQILRVAQQASVSPASDVYLVVPVGLEAIGVPGVSSPHIIPRGENSPIDLSCGFGPPIDVDGTKIPTSVSGTFGDLLDLSAMRFVACPTSVAVDLGAGRHTFSQASSASPFQVTSVAFQSVTDPTPSVPAPRTAAIRAWSAENRSVRVSAGPSTFLTIAQNYNTGWVATFEGRTLKPVRIDGWQQGYVVPAGAAGTITLTMSDDSSLRALLLLGAAFLVALFLLALIPPRRRVEDTARPRSLPSAWVIVTASAVALFVAAGPLALVVVPLLWVARRWGSRAMAVTAFLSFLVAGIAAALSPAAVLAPTAGAFGRPAQIASVVALAAVLCSLIAERQLKPDVTRQDELLLPRE